MPCISMFYGLLIYMYWYDNEEHKLPHVHVKYQEYEAVFSINDAVLLKGSLPAKKHKMIEVWIDLHQEELLADWELATQGGELFKIEALR
jgi:hypothetical protein